MGTIGTAALTGCSSTPRKEGQSRRARLHTWIDIEPTRPDISQLLPLGASNAPIDSRGTLVVNEWASFCAPCLEELPVLERVHRSGRVSVVGVSRDASRSAAESLLTRVEITFPNFWDGDGTLARSLAAHLPANRLPKSVLVVDGLAVAVHLGALRSARDVTSGMRRIHAQAGHSGGD